MYDVVHLYSLWYLTMSTAGIRYYEPTKPNQTPMFDPNDGCTVINWP